MMPIRTQRHSTRTIPWLCAVFLAGGLGLAGCGASQKPAEAPAGAPGTAPAEAQPTQSGAGADEHAAPSGATEPAPMSPPSAAAPGGAMPRSSKAAEGETEKGPDEFEVLARKLEGTLALSTPDCTTAWALRDRICDLAQRLCDLANRSAEAELTDRCTDGRARCERATSRVRRTCAD